MVKTFKEIYNSLEDEKSKRIYMDRLGYAITGDFNYVIDMVNNNSNCKKDWDELAKKIGGVQH